MTDHKLIVRRSQAKRRATHKKLGLCIQCGKEKRPGKTLCEACQKKQNEAQKRYYARRRTYAVSTNH